MAVWLTRGEVASAEYYGSTRELLEGTASAAVVAIDVPIGLTNGTRDADLGAAALLGSRRSSLFPMPPRALATLEYAEAREQWQGASEKGFSRQTWAILPKVLEAEQLIYEADPFGARIIEVHPELSFSAMAKGQPLKYSKRSWNGYQERLSLLESVGLSVARDQGDLGKAAPDDLLDAYAAAWTADRFSRDDALSVPEQPTQFDRDRPIQIWR